MSAKKATSEHLQPEETAVRRQIERVQTGVRIEKRILKVLKGFAEARDITLGDLREGVALHYFEGKCPFGEESLKRIVALREVYDLDLTAEDSHFLVEQE